MNKLIGRIKRKVTDTGLKLPRIGKIKVGQKHPEKGYPMSLDYFVCDSKYARFFKESYGEKPKKIQIVFLSDEFTDSCDERWECRDSNGRLTGKGDGQSWFLWNGSDYGLVDPEKNKVELKSAGKWEVILTIRFVIPAIKGVFGVFEFSTKAEKSSIPQIRDTFDNVQEMAGTIINIPFDLIVEKVVSQKPDSKNKYPVVSLVANLGSENLELLKGYYDSGGQQQIRQLGVITEDKIKHLTDGQEKKP